MRDSFVLVTALLVTTALVGGFAGVAAGTGPTTTGQTAADVEPALGDSASVQQAEGECSFPVTVTDATGEEITLEEPPERITTTNPSAAQTLWELGAQDRVVGVTEFALYLDGADEKAGVSAEGLGVDIERVVDTDPDLVLAPNASEGQVEDLRNAGLTVYHFPEATDVSAIETKTETIGQLVGECEAAAETNEEMNDAVADVRERTADIDRPAALYPLGSGFVAANNTFIDEVMTIGGTENVAAAEGDGYPQLSDEVILQTDPELILVNEPDAPIMNEEPYASTTAGQEGNAIVVEVQWLNQPAPRSVIVATDSIADGVEAYNAAQTEDETTDESADDSTDDETADGDADDSTENDTDDAPSADDDAPGFGVVAAVVAMLAAGLLARRE